MKYTVQMTRLAVVWRSEEIEADSEEDAEAKAIAFADDEGDAGWELNGVYDDGKPHSKISVNEIEGPDPEEEAIKRADYLLDKRKDEELTIPEHGTTRRGIQISALSPSRPDEKGTP